jgi:WXG100 family type VII secretion target
MSQIQVTPDRLRSLASTCSKQATAVGSVRTSVRGAIASSGWDSPAATRFKNDWNTHYESALKKLEAALSELGAAASKMAANYDSTESAYRGMS